MVTAAISAGIVLILTGLGFYVAAAEASMTALIPSALGILILIAGLLGTKEKIRRHAMHFAALLGLLGILGSLMGIKGWVAMLQGQAVARPLAEWERLVMLVVCVVFLAACIRSFVKARQLRDADES